MKILKRLAIKKIVVSSLCLILMILFYLVPTNEEYKIEVKNNNYNEVVYLLDKDNYVSKVNTFFDYNSVEEEIKKKIDILTNLSNDTFNFNKTIPSNTKLLGIKVDKNNVYLDFSKELLNVNKYIEEGMIESIVYSLTEINGIDNIYINVEGKPLKYLPNSKTIIDYPLNRSYGINKKYDIDDFNNIDRINLVFYKEDYYVPITKIMNINDDKINIIINELKSMMYSLNNLYSFVSSNIELKDYEIKKNKITLVFNDYLFKDKIILEKVCNIISYSLFENYNVDEIVFSNTEDNNTLVINKY